MAQYIFATTTSRCCSCSSTRAHPAIPLQAPLLPSSSRSLRVSPPRRSWAMGASDRLAVAAAKPRHAAPCAATVLGEPLPASDDHGLVDPSADFSAQALVSSPQQYQEIYRRSIDDPAGFWSEIAETFYWKQKWNPDEVCTENLDVTKGPIKIEWFKGGKPTCATMPWTVMLKREMVRRLQCIGRGMSLIRTESSPTLSSWIKFASWPII
ncbi:hypothetical protein ACQ4PT_041934 [Festuca glaucescens]